MTIQSTPSETAKIIGTVLPFFNKLALRLSFNLNDEMKVVQDVLSIFIKNPARSHAIFFLAVVKHSPKEILISYLHVLIDFIFLLTRKKMLL